MSTFIQCKQKEKSDLSTEQSHNQPFYFNNISNKNSNFKQKVLTIYIGKTLIVLITTTALVFDR